jgi:cell wall-associated NlpC family hydrolase
MLRAMRTLLTASSLALLPVLTLLAACDHSSAFSATPESATAASGQAAPATPNAVATLSGNGGGGANDDDTADDEQGSEGDEQALPAAPHAAVADNSPRAFVTEIDRELANLRTSSYSHRTSIDEATGAFNYDCSGFVGYALEGSAPTAFQELRNATVKRPLAKHFETFFASLPSNDAPHWARVAKVSELAPGDIVAWLKVPGSSSKNTGHVVTVHGAVTPEGGHPGSYLVPIADSTSLRHGRTDSRYANKATGLGTGTLVLVADESGAPVAYRWSLGKKSRELATSFAMGRLSAR